MRQSLDKKCRTFASMAEPKDMRNNLASKALFIYRCYDSLNRSCLFSVLIFSLFSLSTWVSPLSAQVVEVEDAEKIIVRLSPSENLSKETKLTKLDSSIFFVNVSKDSLLTVAVDFGNRKAHCASGNMKWFKEERILRSIEPISPKDFAAVCFPESGSYKVSVYGLKSDGSASVTNVLVP